jgi:hypothetical protein
MIPFSGRALFKMHKPRSGATYRQIGFTDVDYHGVTQNAGSCFNAMSQLGQKR